jgi:hypothetical protein
MRQNSTAGEGSIYANGMWLASVNYTISDNHKRISLRICDGERDLFASPIPAHELLLELSDGSCHWFTPSHGNPTAGTYVILR